MSNGQETQPPGACPNAGTTSGLDGGLDYEGPATSQQFGRTYSGPGGNGGGTVPDPGVLGLRQRNTIAGTFSARFNFTTPPGAKRLRAAVAR